MGTFRQSIAASIHITVNVLFWSYCIRKYILVHREFSSAFPAKLIIEPDRITTENWNRSQFLGKIDPQAFTPYPKNPLLAKFFMNIGRADTLGSGVRNLYKYTKIYCGGTPALEEGDVFRICVPLKTNEQGENSKYKLTNRQTAILKMIREDQTLQYADIAESLEVSTATIKRDIQEIKKQVQLQYDKKTSLWTVKE